MIDAVSYPGCGTGVVCPIMQSNSARCNRCDFNSTTTVCGSVPGHHAAPTTPAPGDGSVCSTGEEKVYSGLDLAFTGKPLMLESRLNLPGKVQRDSAHENL